MMTLPRPFVMLLADDEPADAHLVKAALRENQMAVELHHVTDGRAVLAFLRRQGEAYAQAPRPHLILLDLNMPRMDGRECLAAIKQDAALCDIAVVILSTSEVQRDVAQAYQLGASGFLTKAVDMDQFLEDMRQLVSYWMHLVRLPNRE